MCSGVALALSEFPTEMHPSLSDRIHDRGGEKEARFLYRHPERVLPVWRGGKLQLVRWGGKRGGKSVLPVQGWTWLEKIESGWWKDAGAESVDIAATVALANGVWFSVRQGMRGLLVTDEVGVAAVYMVCTKASHYYRIMTGRAWMPVLIDEEI